MAVGLRLATTRQTFKLLLKTFALTLLVWWLEANGPGIFSVFLFFILYGVFYLRPSFNRTKFLPSAIIIFILPFFIPEVEGRILFAFVLAWAIALFLLLGVKNFLILNQEGAYYLLHLLELIGLTILFFLGIIPEIIIFIILFLLFREFYFILGPVYPERLTLIAAVEALILIQISWVISFLSLQPLATAAFIVLGASVFNDTAIHHLRGTLSRQIILRNTTLFTLLSLIVIGLPK